MFDRALNPPSSRLDKLQLAAIGGLMIIGAAFVYSATLTREGAAVAWYGQSWFRQVFPSVSN